MEGIPTSCNCATHSCTHIERLERDARVAAELGQALLVRHEAYVASAEEDRKHILGSVQSLEREKKALETDNADLVEENRALLDRLESLNNALIESEAQVQSLTAALQSTQEQLRRMTALAARTEFLEKQLASLEIEQADLQQQLATSKADERGAALRARKAERTLSNLYEEIERIEREAREDKERHNEVIGRMERRRAVERELETAAGRLKGAAAAKASGENAGNNVVGHFVKDILQDNANLQLGIVELREMLYNSNEEVARLREQLLLDAPEPDEAQGGLPPRLARELTMDNPQSREVHVHHHFHEPTRKENDNSRKQAPQRRVRKRKNVSISSIYSSSGPTSRIGTQTPSSTATILAQTSVSIPAKNASQRWSIQSNQTGATTVSSVPSSPFTHSRRTSSIFERVFSDGGYEDSSRPTSPELSELGSPAFAPLKMPAHALVPPRSQSTSTTPRPGDAPPKHDLSLEEDFYNRASSDDWNLATPVNPSGQSDTILEEDFDDQDTTPTLGNMAPPSDAQDIFTPTRPLRRTASHESLISISGMDIHTLQSRPSQLLSGRLLGPAIVAAPSISLTSSKPVSATVARATVSRASSSGSGDSGIAAAQSKALLSNMVARRRQSSDSDEQQVSSGLGAFGRSVGGWVKGSWGFAPTPSNNNSIDGLPVQKASPNQQPERRASSGPEAVPRVRSTPQPPRLKAMKSTPALPPVREAGPLSSADAASKADAELRKLFRAPGINQPGPLFGMRAEPPTPFKTSVEPGKFDEDALREGLTDMPSA